MYLVLHSACQSLASLQRKPLSKNNRYSEIYLKEALCKGSFFFNVFFKPMKQAERIQRMEHLFDFVLETMKEFPYSLDKYTEAKEAVTTLSAYYGSEEWKQDYADDEAGLLPKDLKRGVLSEDGIWNLLSEWEEMNGQLDETGVFGK
jgi:hypothetical protein